MMHVIQTSINYAIAGSSTVLFKLIYQIYKRKFCNIHKVLVFFPHSLMIDCHFLGKSDSIGLELASTICGKITVVKGFCNLHRASAQLIICPRENYNAKYVSLPFLQSYFACFFRSPLRTIPIFFSSSFFQSFQPD